MSDQGLYDEDILLWSEQQAAAIRKLGRNGREVPNELDIENVAEEIESVGRSELAAVKSQIRLIFIHLIKLFVEADSQAARHWRGEVVAFHSEMIGRYSPSMRQRISINELWRSARDQSILAYEGDQQQRVADLPVSSVLTLDDLLAERIDSFGLVERLRLASSSGRPECPMIYEARVCRRVPGLPELKSRPFGPHPLLASFIEAAVEQSRLV